MEDRQSLSAVFELLSETERYAGDAVKVSEQFTALTENIHCNTTINITYMQLAAEQKQDKPRLTPPAYDIDKIVRTITNCFPTKTPEVE